MNEASAFMGKQQLQWLKTRLKASQATWKVIASDMPIGLIVRDGKYDPEKAVFKDFDPFWEFVSGPLHAGTFGPGELDNTFGPELRFKSIPEGMKANRPPSEGFQFFGLVKIDAKTRVMTVTHYNAAGNDLWNIDMHPQA